MHCEKSHQSAQAEIWAKKSLVVAPAITEGPVSITLESLFKKFHVCRFHTEYQSVMRQVHIPNPYYWSLASQSIKLPFYSRWDEIKKNL